MLLWDGFWSHVQAAQRNVTLDKHWINTLLPQLHSEEVGKGCIWHLGLSDNHLGCDGSGDLSSNPDSVITLNLRHANYSPGSYFARSWTCGAGHSGSTQIVNGMLHALSKPLRQICHRNGELTQTSAFHISEIEGNWNPRDCQPKWQSGQQAKELHSLTREF